MNDKLPEMRCIRSPEYDTSLTEDEVDAIEDAICDGRQLQCFVSKERTQYGNEPVSEACQTVFIEPFTQITRYAVEVWDRNRIWKWDFSTRSAADTHLNNECDRLGI